MTIIHLPNISIFDSGAQVLACPVNLVGVMGAGLALGFKRRYPEVVKPYLEYCSDFVTTVPSTVIRVIRLDDGKDALLFPTKHHWKQPSDLELIKLALEAIRDTYSDLGLHDLCLPKVGCGLGGLDWSGEVRPLVYEILDDLDLITYIYW